MKVVDGTEKILSVENMQISWALDLWTIPVDCWDAVWIRGLTVVIDCWRYCLDTGIDSCHWLLGMLSGYEDWLLSSTVGMLSGYKDWLLLLTVGMLSGYEDWLLGMLSGYRGWLLSLTVGVAIWIQEPAVIGYWDCCLDTGTDCCYWLLGMLSGYGDQLLLLTLGELGEIEKGHTSHWIGDGVHTRLSPGSGVLVIRLMGLLCLPFVPSPWGVTSVKESIVQATPLLGPTLTRHPTALVVTLRRRTSSLFFWDLAGLQGSQGLLPPPVIFKSAGSSWL